jgi:hypothetical protein
VGFGGAATTGAGAEACVTFGRLAQPTVTMELTATAAKAKYK